MQIAVKIPDEKIDFAMEVLNSLSFVESAEVIDFNDIVEKNNKELVLKNLKELAGKVDLGITDYDIAVSRGRIRGAELHRRFMCMD